MEQTIIMISLTFITYMSIKRMIKRTSIASIGKILVLICALFLSSVSAQSQGWITGVVKDSLNGSPIAKATVSGSLGKVSTDNKGSFTIQVIEGETLIAAAKDYLFTTLLIKNNIDTTLNFYLVPIGRALENINIATNQTAYQIDSIRRRNAFESGVSKQTAVSKLTHPGFGLVINLDHFTKDKDKHIKRQRKLFEKTEQWAYVRSRFPDTLVQSYTRLTGEELRIFLYKNTPSYEWLRKHPSREDVFNYINDKLILWRKENFSSKSQ